jgi:hypothetical protein
MHTGGRRGEGEPHVPPIKIFEKLSHKNAIKHDTPLIFSQPQVPPSNDFAKKTQGPPWISNYCASMGPAAQSAQGVLNLWFLFLELGNGKIIIFTLEGDKPII